MRGQYWAPIDKFQSLAALASYSVSLSQGDLELAPKIGSEIEGELRSIVAGEIRAQPRPQS